MQVDPSIIRKWGERPWESPKSIKMQITAKSFTQDDGKIVRLMLPQPALLVPNKRYTLTTANVSAEFTPFAADLLHQLPFVLTWHS